PNLTVRRPHSQRALNVRCELLTQKHPATSRRPSGCGTSSLTDTFRSRWAAMHDANKESLKFRLHATMVAKFTRTKRAWAWALCASLGILGLSMASVLVVTPSVSAVIDFLSVLLGVA